MRSPIQFSFYEYYIASLWFSFDLTVQSWYLRAKFRQSKRAVMSNWKFLSCSIFDLFHSIKRNILIIINLIHWILTIYIFSFFFYNKSSLWFVKKIEKSYIQKIAFFIWKVKIDFPYNILFLVAYIIFLWILIYNIDLYFVNIFYICILMCVYILLIFLSISF